MLSHTNHGFAVSVARLPGGPDAHFARPTGNEIHAKLCPRPAECKKQVRLCCVSVFRTRLETQTARFWRSGPFVLLLVAACCCLFLLADCCVARSVTL